MKLENLAPEQIVYDAHKSKMGNTTMRSMGVWQVKIISVDLERQTVEASWNDNSPRTYGKESWSKWRAVKPILIGSNIKRLATKEETKRILLWRELRKEIQTGSQITYRGVQDRDYFVIISGSGMTAFRQDSSDQTWEESASATRPRPTRLSDAAYVTIEDQRMVYVVSREIAAKVNTTPPA